MTVRELRVSLGERSYPILIGAGLLGGSDALAKLAQGRQVAVVSNDTVGELYEARLAELLAGAAARVSIRLPDGEAYKNWESLDRVFDRLLRERFDRQCLLVALGGGVIGDLTGFAAAVYQRGVDFVQVPTTLLAQVDSSVGGKTAINHPLGKNMIGAFHQPKLVLADVDTLRTLPPREISAGLAEMIKHGAIADPGYLARLERDLAALRACDAAALVDAVLRSCEIKAAVVAADEREAGVRATLNFGHTFGHVIESLTGRSHGESIWLGLLFAVEFSLAEGYLKLREAEALSEWLKLQSAPLQKIQKSQIKIKTAEARKRLLQDKKRVTGSGRQNVQDEVRFVFVRGLGKTVVAPVSVEKILKVAKQNGWLK